MSLVKVISQTIQEYNGVRYYLCGPYFQKKGKRLHRTVWEDNNGPVPEGYHIHHIDHNTSNNELSNLKLMANKAHSSYHSKKSGHGKTTIALAQDAANAWHGSPEGKAWHREHYAEHLAPVFKRKAETECQVCGKTFETQAVNVHNAKYCGNNCRQQALRNRRKALKG